MNKQDIRALYLKKRKALSEKEVEEKSIAICDAFFKEIDLSTIYLLHTFIPIQKFKEVNTWKLIHRIWHDFPHIKTATSITEEDQLIHVLIDKDTLFEEDKWGIPTPINGKEIEVNQIDLVVTPLLAFDKKLHRVGYGKGYYDRFFSACKADIKKIGVSIFPPLESIIEDTNGLDIALDEVIYA